MPATGTRKLQANRAMGYGGKNRLVGEVFDRQYLRNDETLIQAHYVREADDLSEGQLAHCDQCGRDFATASFYEAHHPTCAREREPRAKGTVPKLEDEYPGGITIDPATRQPRARGR